MQASRETGVRNIPFNHQAPSLCQSHLDKTTAQSVKSGSLTLLSSHEFIRCRLKKLSQMLIPHWNYDSSRLICIINHQWAKDSTLHRFSCSASLWHVLVVTLQRFNDKQKEVALTHPKSIHANCQTWILMNNVTRHRFRPHPPFPIYLIPEIKNDIKLITWLLHF